MGGGSPSTTVQSNEVPEWAKPYFERTLGRAETESLKPYEAYTGQRIAKAGDVADINQSRDITRGVVGQGIAGLGAAQDYSGYALNRSKELGQYDPTKASEFQFDPTRQFSGQEVQELHVALYAERSRPTVSSQQLQTLIVRTLLVLIKGFKLEPLADLVRRCARYG
jgi:hypothetical protein